MRCAEYTEFLQSYLDADLDEPRRLVMQSHRQHCYSCTEALDEYRTLFHGLDRMEREAAPPGIVAAVLRRLPPACRGPEPSTPQPLPLWARHRSLCLGGASAVVVSLLLGSFCVSPSPWGARLGTLATWWYAWVGDLVGTLTWLRASSVAEIEQAATALFRAGALLLRAGAVHLLFFWTLATVAGLWLSARQRATGHVPRHS